MDQGRRSSDRADEARSPGQGRRHPRGCRRRQAAIEGTTVEIAAKVSESGKLFGSVTAEQIALALSDKAAVNPKAIEVEPIKTTGDFPAKAALHPEITASFFVKVVAE